MPEHDASTTAETTIDLTTIDPPGGAIEALDLRDREAHDDLERTLLDEHVDVDALSRYRDRLSRVLRPGPIRSFAWPSSWYVPGDADYRQHWIVPPPADHRYGWAAQNSIGGAPAGSHASAATGRLFAWSNASSLGSSTVGYARTGAYVRPTATLATYDVSASVDVATEWRWWFLASAGASPYATFHYRSTAYVAGWQVNPVDGAWELLRPFAARTLLSTRARGSGSFAVEHARHAFDDLHVRLQLERGRTYAIGVSFETQVTPTVVDQRGAPYVRQPGDDIRCWSSMLGDVSRIEVRPETIWMP